MKVIIFDFEVFKFDTLLGAIIVENDKEEIFQSWDLNEIKNFYEIHKNDIWIGWNNSGYDNFILEALIKNQNLFEISNKIINEHQKFRLTIPLIYFDLMSLLKGFVSLKLTELISGKNIHTTDVDFNLNRNLTNEEKKLTEEYNLDDLKQTLYNYRMFYDKFQLRLDIIEEFKLNLKENLNVTGTKLAANVLKAKYNPSLQYKEIEIKLYDNLKLKNKELLTFFLTKGYRKLGKGETLKINISGAELNIGKGGVHSAINKYHTEKFLYLDVSGYYNLIMLRYDLLPRTIPQEGKELYEFMYDNQLKLKTINPRKRSVYKTVLLAVFGSMNNEYTDFFDPHKFILVTTSGELFICDLLEKLEGLVKVIQGNTDGLALEPYNWEDLDKIISIVEEWEKRTKFVIKKEIKYNLWQRDVNCYFCQDDKGKLEYKGEAVINYNIDKDAYSEGNIFKCKEPPIIARGIIDYLIFGIFPEDTVNKFNKDFRYFQYSCRKETYDYLTYDIQDIKTGKVISKKIDNICRVFAYNSQNEMAMIYKHKTKNGKHSQAKISNLPDNIFVYNYNITTEKAINEITQKIDFQYYIDRIYERIAEFVGIENEEKSKKLLF